MSNISVRSSGNNKPLPNNAITKVTFYKNCIDTVTSTSGIARTSPLLRYRRYSKNKYIDTETGEILTYNDNNAKNDNTKSVKHSMKNIYSLVLNNFAEQESFYITLTYSYHMDDFNKANNDFTAFIDKFKYRMGEIKIEYLKVIEAQESGSWHFHVLIKSSNYRYFRMTKGKVEDCWKHGSVKIQQVYDTKGLALYLGGRFNHTGGYKTKMTKKSDRWKYYPIGARIFSKSSGIVYPKTVTVQRGDLVNALKDYKKLNESDIVVIDEKTDRVLNRIRYETYENPSKFSI